MKFTNGTAHRDNADTAGTGRYHRTRLPRHVNRALKPVHGPILVIAAISCTFLGAWLLTAWADGLVSASWPAMLFLFARGTCIAIPVVWFAREIRRLARERDTDSDRSAQAQLSENASRIRRENVFRASRTLHDTVVNTLGAIALGLPSSDTEAIKLRCRADIAAIDHLDQRAPRKRDSASEVIEACEARAAVLGLAIEATMAGPPITLPDYAVDDLIAAASEALVNISKHAETRAVTLRIETTDDGIEVTVADEGRGFDVDSVKLRGIAESIERRAGIAGASSSVRSHVGTGTQITLRWSSSVRPDAVAPLADATEVWLKEVALVLGRKYMLLFTGLVLFGFTLAALGQDSVPSLPLAAGGVGVAVGCVAYVLVRTRTCYPLRIADLIVIGLGCAISVLAVTSDRGTGCSVSGVAWLAPALGQVFLGIGATMFRRIWPLIVIWLVYVSALLSVVLSHGTECNLPAAVLGGSDTVAFILWLALAIGLPRYVRAGEGVRAQLWQSLSSSHALQAKADHDQVRIESVVTAVRPFLLSIAEGERDGTSAQAAIDARQLERLSREIAELPEIPESAERLLVGLMLHSHASGIDLMLMDVNVPSEPPDDVLRDLESASIAAVSSLLPGDQLKLTWRAMGDAVAVVLVATSARQFLVPEVKAVDAEVVGNNSTQTVLLLTYGGPIEEAADGADRNS